jgi:hypothetical protein
MEDLAMPGGRELCGFGNPRYSRLGSLRHLSKARLAIN